MPDTELPPAPSRAPLYAVMPPRGTGHHREPARRIPGLLRAAWAVALPRAGGGHPRALRRQERHPQHAHRVGQVAGRAGGALEGRGRWGPLVSTRRPSRRWSARSSSSCARRSGPQNVGMMTGDASINRDASVICCTAEILSNLALREGDQADLDMVVIDEFHFYSERDRGVAWQVPLLTLPQARFPAHERHAGRHRALRGVHRRADRERPWRW
jgi:hypothetical protein